MHTNSYNQRTACAARAPRRVGAAAAALACVALVSACGSSKSPTTSSAATKTNLDTARVVRSIEQSIASQRHLTSTVVCPTAVPQEAGRKFECVATTRTTKTPVKTGKTTFVVTEQNNKGYVTYEGK